MLLYLVRRLAGAVVVLVALSVVVFVIFVVVPGGDPAQRIAGKNATAQGIANVRHTWGFDRPLPVQYARLMQRMVSGTLVSYTSQQNVVQQIVAGAAGDVLADDRRRRDLAAARRRGRHVRRPHAGAPSTSSSR